MVVTATPIFPQTITNKVVTIVNADTTTLKTLYAAGTNGTKVENILVTNTDTAAYTVQVYVTISATDYLIGSVNIPLSAGNLSTVNSVNLLSTTGNLGPVLNLDSTGNPYLYLASGSTLKVATTGTVTAAKTITFFAQGGDF